MALVDFILHIDAHMVSLVHQYGLGIYPILFAIVFIETGVVIFHSCLEILSYLRQGH